MSPVSINYDLGRHGWSNFKLTVGDVAVEVGPFGYCTDALGDLVRAALMLATSDYRAEVSFDGEPREWRLVIDEGLGLHWPALDADLYVPGILDGVFGYRTWTAGPAKPERKDGTANSVAAV